MSSSNDPAASTMEEEVVGAVRDARGFVATIEFSQWLRRAYAWTLGEGRGRWLAPPLLVFLLVVGLGLRLYGIAWDQGNFFHPDERSIYMRVECMHRLLTQTPGFEDCKRDEPFRDTVAGIPSPVEFMQARKSPLNPHWFPLGTMIIYLLLGIKLLLAPVLTMSLQDLALAGRALSAVADTATIAMVYLLGKRLFNRGAGLLAATLLTFAVIHIQHSHFYRPEPLTNLFVVSAMWGMLRVVDLGRLRDSVILGVFVGLALATKVSALPIVIPLAVTYGYVFFRACTGAYPEERATVLESVGMRALSSFAVSVAVYLLWTPYALLGFPEFLDWILRELEIVRNAGSVPYTVQYVGAPNLIYEIRQTTIWGLGVPLGLLGWGCFALAIFTNARRPRLGEVLLLLWAVPLLVLVASAEVKFVRYTFPLMPILILLGAGLGTRGIEWLKTNRRRLAIVGRVGLAAVVAATVLYGVAFEAIYTKPHPAVQASEWINATVPEGAVILTDNHWDEGIPNLGRYRVIQLPMFEGDSAAKMETLASNLEGAEYLVFYSNRTYGAIARIPGRYPLSSSYYRLLFSGDLGYELERSFQSDPRLLGVTLANDPFRRAGLARPPSLEQRSGLLTLDLGYADNDVITYDHPMTMIFKNTAKYSEDSLLALLLAPRTGRQ